MCVATGVNAVIVTVVLPVFPSLVATIFAVPGATPVTTPVVELIVAIPTALDIHDTVRPVSTLPLASLVTALACVVAPTEIVGDARLTVTEATGAGGGGGGGGGGKAATMVTWAEPVLPSDDAMIVADPAASPATSPELGSTVATAEFDDVQLTTRPESTFPLASRSVADACVVAPILTLTSARLTPMDATGIGGGAETVTVALPATPVLTAVIVAVPGDTPVTTPVEPSIVATLAFDDDQVTGRPVRTLP